MSKAIWKSKNEPDLSLVENLKSALNAPDIIARMLVQRGIDTIDKVNAYFNPRVEDLHDPFLMKDMDKAIERVQLAQEKKEGVLIYGDYDVDGTTSVALVYSFFKDKFDKIDFYNHRTLKASVCWHEEIVRQKVTRKLWINWFKYIAAES